MEIRFAIGCLIAQCYRVFGSFPLNCVAFYLWIPISSCWQYDREVTWVANVSFPSLVEFHYGANSKYCFTLSS